MKGITLARILGYQLDITRHAALRSLHRFLAGSTLTPPSLTALIHVRDHPGCDQTTLGRALAGDRSLGMKVAGALEAKGLLTRRAGRDRRSKGLYITDEGERILADGIARHARAEAVLAAHLAPDERELLMLLLAKVQQAIEEEAALAARHSPLAAASDLAAHSYGR